jgi:hypothetical protein
VAPAGDGGAASEGLTATPPVVPARMKGLDLGPAWSFRGKGEPPCFPRLHRA